jgi:hypothetical protein
LCGSCYHECRTRGHQQYCEERRKTRLQFHEKPFTLMMYYPVGQQNNFTILSTVLNRCG